MFFYGENLNRYPPYNNDKLLEEIFDLIVGFKSKPESQKYIRFPLWLLYYPYYDFEPNNNILSYIQNKYNMNIKKQKTFGCSMISRHDRGGQRKIIYDVVKKYTSIVSPGAFMNNTTPIGPGHENKITFISQGLFNICPENSCYENYFTEKIFQAFEGGTIPIYWGVDYPEKEIINKNKYIFFELKNSNENESILVNALKNTSKILSEPLFNKNANIYVTQYYTSLKQSINRFI
jgi:hypothetical protein